MATSTALLKNLSLITRTHMVSAATGTGTGSCKDYGTYDYTTTYNAAADTYIIAIIFKLCRNDGIQYDGDYAANGKTSQFIGRLGDLKIMNFKNNYTTLIGSLVGMTLSFTMAGSGDDENAAYTITSNGTMQAFDYYSLGQHVMTFSAFKADLLTSTDTAANTKTSIITANGRYSVRHLQSTAAVTYADFVVNTTMQPSSNIEDVDIAGRVAVDYTPDSYFEGIFDVTTTTPIRSVTAPYPPKTTQGTFTINDTATFQYGAIDTVDISITGDSPKHYAKEFMLMKEPELYAMEQQLPIVSGTTGTATGGIMSISALSSGQNEGDLNCFTDVHVKYCSADKLPTPQASHDPLWIVDFQSGLDTCVSTTAIAFEEATSSTGVVDDVCDVGLDINAAATDIYSGGVEHFLAAALPSGYYVLSINNYSCPLTVTNAATILVGDYLFGPYSCAYTNSDGDGTNAGAWCRLADIRVNTDGIIEVLDPNLTLTPWH